MIKLLAAAFMLIDHIGTTFFPDKVVFPMLGRLSMPLFAYCIARGCYFTRQKGTWGRYLKNLGIFSIVSQIPFTILFFYCLHHSFQLNIGFTWLLAAMLLQTLTSDCRQGEKAIKAALLTGLGLILPVEYGIYGILYPTVFYFSLIVGYKPLLAFAGSALIYVLYMLLDGVAIQIFAIASVPVLLILFQHDDLVRLHKGFFYIFYPAHILVLVLVKCIVLVLQYT